MVNLDSKTRLMIYTFQMVPTEIVNKMKLLSRGMCSKMDVFTETNLEPPVIHIHHYKNLLSSYGIEYQEVVIDEIDSRTIML